MSFIQFDNFSYYYKAKKEAVQALKNITLNIEKGSLVAIIGQSGSGKTTLIKSIMGKCSYIDGSLSIDGVDVEEIDIKKSNFAYISQEISLYPHMTVFDNIAFPLKMMGASFDEITRRVQQVAKTLDIDWLLTRKTKQLSLGQCQKVAIARAIIKKPKIMLFDEPFANIDGIARVQLQQLVQDIHRQTCTTTIFVTHHIPEALMLGQKIAVLEEGKLTQFGTAEEILQNPTSQLIQQYLKDEANSPF